MMKKQILALMFALVAAQSHAESAHVQACVKWWGGDIPQAERTIENCPTGTNHWDSSRRAEQGASAPIQATAGTAGDNFYSGSSTTMSGRTYNLPNASYMVIRNGSTTTVLQTSKTR